MREAYHGHGPRCRTRDSFPTYWCFPKSHIHARDIHFLYRDAPLPSAPASGILPCDHRSSFLPENQVLFSRWTATMSGTARLASRHGACRGHDQAMRLGLPEDRWISPTSESSMASFRPLTTMQTLLTAVSIVHSHPPFPDLFLK